MKNCVCVVVESGIDVAVDMGKLYVIPTIIVDGASYRVSDGITKGPYRAVKGAARQARQRAEKFARKHNAIVIE
jgi:hypothetical protein